MTDAWTTAPDVADDDVPLTFCDQCGHLQIGLRAACERCGVPLDRSVYDPFVAIHQNAAVVRQAIRGRAKPSAFGKAAVVLVGPLYLAFSVVYLPRLLWPPLTIVAVFVVFLDLVIVALMFSALRGMLQRDSWNEYRRWE
jgi:hypothetical protein